MANAMYDYGREGFLAGDYNWLTSNMKAVLVDTAAYTPNTATDQFLSDIPSGSRIATSANLTGKTATGGVARASNTTLAAVTGAVSELVVVYYDTGSAATSRLIAKVDTATNLPITPNGGDITIQWDTGANGIFKL